MIKGNILMMVPFPDLTKVYRMVSQEETPKDFYRSTNQNETLAFVAHKRRMYDNSSQNSQNSKNSGNFQYSGNFRRQGFTNSAKRFNKKPNNSYYCTHYKIASPIND